MGLIMMNPRTQKRIVVIIAILLGVALVAAMAAPLGGGLGV